MPLLYAELAHLTPLAAPGKFASGSIWGVLRVWDVATGQCEQEMRLTA